MQWLKEIPSHWEERKISSLFRERRVKVSDKDYQPLSISKIGITPQLETAVKTDNGDNRKLVLKGDFVVNSRSDRRGSCGVSDLDGSVSLINIVLCPHKQINGNYFHHLARSNDYIEEYYRLGRGIVADLWTTRYSELKGMVIPLPPLVEQEQIVRYLEDKTSKIDAYVSEKEKEILFLQELKQKTIADAVTKGLNPDVKTKDSCISWIGEIPEHWEVKQLRSFLTLFTEKGHGDAQLLSVTREQGVIERDKDDKDENHNFVPDDLSGYKYIEKGDFAINKMKAWQGSYAVSNYDGIVSPAYFTCKLKGVNKDFFSKAIRSRAYVPFFTQYSKGIRVGQWDLNPNALKSIPFFLPPADEQRAIVSYIEEKCQKIDSLTTELQSEIDYLKEYKQRLIADCVTGQVNVQNH